MAARAGVSKRTFHDRFVDKAALFHAVVHHIIGAIRPPPGVPLIEGATVPQVLERLAGLMLKAALSPRAIGLIVRVLSGAPTRPPVNSALRAFAAEQFIHLVVSVPQRRAMGFGTPMAPSELDAWARQVVRLFLDGYRGLARPGRPPV